MQCSTAVIIRSWTLHATVIIFLSKNMNRPLLCMSRRCFCGGNACSRCLSTGHWQYSTGQYWATVPQMPWYSYWARQGIPQITCSLSFASATIYTGNLLKGLTSENEGWQNFNCPGKVQSGQVPNWLKRKARELNLPQL